MSSVSSSPHIRLNAPFAGLVICVTGLSKGNIEASKGWRTWKEYQMKVFSRVLTSKKDEIEETKQAKLRRNIKHGCYCWNHRIYWSRDDWEGNFLVDEAILSKLRSKKTKVLVEVNLYCALQFKQCEPGCDSTKDWLQFPQLTWKPNGRTCILQCWCGV